MISKKIVEIFDIKNGYTPSKAKSEYWTNGIIPWFRMDDLRENGFILSKSKKLITKEAIKGKLFEANSIILATTATIGVHALITSNFLCNQRFTNFCLKEEYKKKFNIKFLYYYFFKIDKWCIRNTVSSAFPSVQINKLKSLQIPILPMEIQNKIVEILDKFTNYKAELAAELTFRKEQYKYYRNILMNKYINKNTFATTLGKVTLINKFKQPQANELEKIIDINGNIPLLPSSRNYNWFTTLNKAKKWLSNGNVITLGRARNPNIKKCEGYFVSSNNIIIESFDEKILSYKYLYYFLDNIKESFYVESASYPKFDRNIFDQTKIPIPPIEIQNKIVEILDKFSALIQNIFDGLPKEIELRNKQYKYYRDLLFNFGEENE